MVDRKKTVVGRKHAALENMYRRFLVGLSPTCPNSRAATAFCFLINTVPSVLTIRRFVAKILCRQPSLNRGIFSYLIGGPEKIFLDKKN